MSTVTLTVVPLAGLWAAEVDARTGLVPKFITVPLWLTGCALSLLEGWGSFVHALGVTGLVFVLCGLVPGLRGMGGGDVKLMMAAAPWPGFNVAAMFAAVATGLLVNGIRVRWRAAEGSQARFRAILVHDLLLAPFAQAPTDLPATRVTWAVALGLVIGAVIPLWVS